MVIIQGDGHWLKIDAVWFNLDNYDEIFDSAILGGSYTVTLCRYSGSRSLSFDTEEEFEAFILAVNDILSSKSNGS